MLGGGRGFEIVNTETRKGLTVNVVFEQRFEGDIRPNYVFIKWEKTFQAEARTSTKVLM